MNLLLEAVAGCLAIDTIDILQKGRQEPTGLRVTARGERRSEPPRRFTSLELEFEIDGDVDPKKAERAVQLSFDTYCSVYHTLREDIELDWSVRIVRDPSS
jgi:putative redox protein